MGKRKLPESEEDDWDTPEVPIEQHEIVPFDPDDVRPLKRGRDGWVYVLPSVNQKKRSAAARTLQAFIRRMKCNK